MTDSYARDKRGVMAWASGITAVVLTGAVGFAHGKLWAHEVELKAITTQQDNDARTLGEIKDILKEMQRDLRGRP